MICSDLQNTMNILVSSDEGYLPPLSVMLYSLAYNNPVRFDVYVLNIGISEDAQQDFKSRMMHRVGDRMTIHFLKADEGIFAGITETKRFKRESTLRLLMLRLLPKDLERILWLDVDIVINGNIQSYYDYPNKGQYALVCEDMFPSYEKSETLHRNGLKHGSRYFNAGVILFYLDNMRKNFSEDCFVDWMRENQEKATFQDQGVLNYWLRKRLSWADAEKYNLQLLRVDDTSVEGRETLKKAKVVHYNTKQKPWNDNYEGGGELLFWSYGVRMLGIKMCVGHYRKKWGL